MRCEPGAGGIICAKCFVKRAYAKGLTDYSWALVPKPPGMDVEMPLRGRVTPRYHRFVGEPPELVRQWYASYLNCQGEWDSWIPDESDATGAPVSQPSSPSSLRSWRTPHRVLGQLERQRPRNSVARSSGLHRTSGWCETQDELLGSWCRTRALWFSSLRPWIHRTVVTALSFVHRATASSADPPARFFARTPPRTWARVRRKNGPPLGSQFGPCLLQIAPCEQIQPRAADRGRRRPGSRPLVCGRVRHDPRKPLGGDRLRPAQQGHRPVGVFTHVARTPPRLAGLGDRLGGRFDALAASHRERTTTLGRLTSPGRRNPQVQVSRPLRPKTRSPCRRPGGLGQGHKAAPGGSRGPTGSGAA